MALDHEAVDYPLSDPQLRMWFAMAMLDDPATYLVPFLVRLQGPMSVPAMAAAVRRLPSRHEMLRARFGVVEGVVRQWTVPTDDEVFQFAGPQLDLDAAQAAAIHEGCRLLDLSRDAPFRAVLYPVGPDDHLLLLAMHHLVTDGVSMNILFEDLGRFYAEAAQAAAPQKLGPSTSRYVELDRPGPQPELERFWTEALAGAPISITWPATGARPRNPDRIAFIETRFSQADVQPVKQLAAHLSVSTFSVLLAGYALLLRLYTDSDEFMIGVPAASRPAGAEEVVGLFVNTLPVRIDLTGDETIEFLVRRVAEQLRAVRVHDALPIDAILRCAGLVRRPNGRQSISTIFNYRSFAAPTLQACGFTVEIRRHPLPPGDTELAIHLEKSGGGLLCRIDYDTALFSSDQVARMADSYAALLRRMAAKQALPARALVAVGSLDTATQLSWGTGPTTALPATTMPALLARALAAHPERIAIEGARRLTYAGLDAEVARMGAVLQAYGVGRGSHVVLAARRSPELVVTMLAALRVGAAFVPTAADWPPARLAEVVAQVRAALVIVDATLSDLPAPQLRVTDAAQAPVSVLDEEPVVRADDVAYVLFTSGSTGKPKGVPIRHESLVNQISWFVDHFGWDPDTRALARTPFWFDASMWEVFAPLAAGGMMILADEDQSREPLALNRLLRRHPVSDLQSVPSLLSLFLDFGAFEGVGGIRRIYCGGEPLPSALVARVASTTGASCVNLYGPTEATVQIACSEVTAPAEVVPIGRPIANVRLLILDAERRLIPAGCPGELWIVGLPVATGYLGEEPGGGFTRDPLGGPDRAYRTGDVVRWLDSGELQFIGRKDRQVKIRGQRIELDEIELALTGLPGVGRAAVHHQTIASGGVLHAFVSGQGGAILSAAALRSALRQMLPSAAVPAHIVTVADLPMLPNGKVDRRAIERMMVAAPGPGVDTPALDFEALAERLRRSG